ncbi:MAG: PQQ-like beta-propeller repeat protein [Planctomycetaceae bacterium]
MQRRFFLALLTTALLTATDSAQAAKPAKSWPSWRGPDRNGISRETGLLSSWSKEGPPLLWKVDGLGKGYSSVSIANGKIYTMGQRRREGTVLIALNLKDGKELWATKVGNGSPNCSPTVDGNLVYALGRSGNLICANAETGEIVWKKNYREEFGGKMMSGWGYSESPLVDGENLICTPGSNDAMLAALDKKTGKVIWKSKMPADIGRRGRDGAGYSSVVISNGAGVKQYIQLVGRGVVSVDAKTGKTLWVYNRVANGTANIPTPIVKDDYVFCSTGYGTGAALLKLEKDGNGVKAVEQYFLNAGTLQNHHGGMILVGDYIYTGHKHNNGFPICVELKTGKVMWGGNIRGPGSGSAAIVYADGHLYFRYENAVMALIEATPKEYRLKGSFKLATRNGRSWPHPVILDGKLYLRDQGTLLCYDITKK